MRATHTIRVLFGLLSVTNTHSQTPTIFSDWTNVKQLDVRVTRADVATVILRGIHVAPNNCCSLRRKMKIEDRTFIVSGG